ncbi:MAG: rod shape-determining protein MreD [Spirochaetales bacterium]|nr:rod shape-determining protein MreD [Spirochaetales bacterium]
MSRDLKAFLLSTGMIAGAIVLQSTLLRWVAVRGVIPDPGLIILVFVGIRRGSMTAQLSGFASGLVEDFLSLSPLGFHAFIRTVVGFLYGLTVGSIFVDPILMPVVLTLVATLIKALSSSLLVSFLAIPAEGFSVFTGPLWIEMGYNAVLAPFMFALLGTLKVFKPQNKDWI